MSSCVAWRPPPLGTSLVALVLKLRKSYLGAVQECRALYRHCLTPPALHTDAGVEAAFLQMYKAWEALQEECTIAFMAGRLRADGKSVPCGVRAEHENTARTLIYQYGAYASWTNVDEVIQRWNRVFGDPNLLVDAIRPGTPELKQMSIVRNSIAHASVTASFKFFKLVSSQIGGRPAISRPGNFLARAFPMDPTRTFFDRYADVLEVLGTSLTG